MIERDEHDGVVTVRLNCGKANALDLELAAEIETIFDELSRSDASAVILTGTGRIFSAGVDLFRILDEGAPYTNRFLSVLDSMFRKVFEFPKPLVTAINGHAIAGGCLLAISGDSRLMADGSGRIGVPELLVGVPFPVYALEMLRLTLHGRTLEQFVYGGTTAQPDAARDAGLIDKVAPLEDLPGLAIEEAQRLAAIPAAAFRLAKNQLRGAASRAVASLDERFNAEITEIWTSETARSAIREYLDRTVRK